MSRARDLANFASDSQINAGEIEDNAVTTAKIADNAITVAKIGDGAVHNVKLANSTIIMSGDSGSDSVALGETMTVAGGTGIDTTGSSNTITIDIDSTVATLTGTQTLTNKTINSASNTITITESNISDLGAYITASSTDTLTNKSGNISQWTNDSGYLTSFTETNDLSSAVTWANVPDANITQSSVTQHQAALSITESQISDLGTYLENVSEDTTPQLGGNLDLNSNDITGTGNINITGNATFSGNLTINGTTTTVNSTTIEITNSFTFEGATADGFETVLGVVDPTADRTINLPNASGTVVLKDTTDTLTNKTINSASNTITITESNISDLGSYIENVVEDTTPQLGGDLSTNGNNINFGDNDKAVFGVGSDLQIYSDGSNSRIEESGSGSLIIRGTQLILQTPTGENLAYFTTDGAAQLYHNNSEKLATTSTGIDVTGTVVSNGLTVDNGGVAKLSVLYSSTSGPNEPELEMKQSTTDGDKRVAYVKATPSDRSANSYSTLKLGTTNRGANDTDLDAISIRQRNDGNSFIDFALDQTKHMSIDGNGDISFYEDTGTTPKFFWDASAEYLGLGTTSPDRAIKIHQDNAYVWIADAAGGNVGFIGGSGQNDGLMRLYEGGGHTARVEIHSDDVSYFNGGNVGIGTSSPGELLHLKSTSESYKMLKLEAGSGSGDAGILFQGSGGNQFGIHQPASSAGMFFYDRTNTTERMRIDSSGKVGIGTSSPIAPLHVYNATSNEIARFQSGDEYVHIVFQDSTTTNTPYIGAQGNHFRIITGGAERLKVHSEGYTELKSSDAYSQLVLTPSGTNAPATINFNTPGTGRAKFKVQNNEYMTILSTGNVGIGTSSPNRQLTVSGSANIVNDNAGLYIGTATSGGFGGNHAIARAALANYHITGSGVGDFCIGAAWQKDILLGTSTATSGSLSARLVITQSGNVGIGITNPGVALDVSGAIRATGDITAFYSSDITLKTNVENIQNPIDKVKQLNGVSYNWTKEAQEKYNHFTDNKEIGVIAQEVEKVLPEIVAERDDGTKAVRYERMCALLIECVKDLQNQIDDLKKGN